MASGNKQPKWDIYEAVILLDGTLSGCIQISQRQKL